MLAGTAKGGHFFPTYQFPEEWRGFRDKELESITGIKDVSFVHASGFIAGELRGVRTAS